LGDIPAMAPLHLRDRIHDHLLEYIGSRSPSRLK
jgi:hypothetical protein